MTEEDWADWFAKSFMVFLNGDALRARDARGRKVRDDSFLLVFNAHTDRVTFTVPDAAWGTAWEPVIDTAVDRPFDETATRLEAGAALEREALSLQVLKRTA